MLETVVSVSALMLASAAVMLWISPEAKHWAAEAIEAVQRFLCAELRARAQAQTAARRTWEQVYREARGAGNWTPAASRVSIDTASVVLGSSAGAALVVQQALEDGTSAGDAR